jgi:hypothetical protein
LTVLAVSTSDGACQAGDAGADVHDDAGDRAADELAFADMQSGPDVEPDRL